MNVVPLNPEDGRVDPAAELNPQETPGDAIEKDIPFAVTRRRFVGLSLTALGTFLAACQRAGLVSPTTSSESTPTTAPQAELPTATPAVTRPASGTPTAASTATSASSPISKDASPSPAHTPSSTSSGSSAPPATYTPVPPTVTEPPPPTATPVPMRTRAELIARWPEAEQSRVVLVRHSGVWPGEEPDLGIVLQMLDDGLRTLADTGGVAAIWQTLFEPGDRVLLKVNCIAYGGPTQPAVAYAVGRRLQEAGVPPENILIFDRTDHELASAGYVVNEAGPGIRCHGSRGTGSEARLAAGRVRFFQELDVCDAIINLPTPKQHGGAGISVSLKNHYGSIDRPGSLHANWCDPGIAELNGQATLREKTRLVVGAALNISPADWNRPVRENALLLSFDPVAHDTVARDLLIRSREALGLDSGFLFEGSRHLRTAQELGLGATDADLIDLREVVLA